MTDLKEIKPNHFGIRNGLYGIFRNLVFYQIHKVELGTCTRIVSHTPASTVAVSFDKLSDSFVSDEDRPSMLLSNTYVKIDPSVIGDDETVDISATKTQFTKTMDFGYDDYTVITKSYPRAGLERRDTRSWELPMTDRVDFSLGIGKKLIVPLTKNKRDIPPAIGASANLVCIVLDPTNPNRRPKWFLASYQLVRLWTLIVYGNEHVSFHKYPDLRSFLFRSVTLATNGFRKWTLGYHDHGEWTPADERENRFWVSREEKSARQYSHVYLAIALMVEYNEWPNHGNLPSGGTLVPPMLHWDLPVNFFENLNSQMGKKVDSYHSSLCQPSQGLAEKSVYWKEFFSRE